MALRLWYDKDTGEIVGYRQYNRYVGTRVYDFDITEDEAATAIKVSHHGGSNAWIHLADGRRVEETRR